MTVTADLRPASPLPETMLSNPDLTKLYMSASCPELKAESVVSSEESDDESVGGRFEPLMETCDEVCDQDDDGAFSMDHHCHEVVAKREGASKRVSFLEAPVQAAELVPAEELYHKAKEEQPKEPRIDLRDQSSIRSPIEPVPKAIEPSPSTDSASVSSLSSSSSDVSSRRKLQWEFKGLTLWLELEEFDNDLTRAVEDFSSRHSSPFIPKPHTTAIYGMEHLSVEEARERLGRVRDVVGAWPAFGKPTGVTSDIAVCGRPGQVCSIAWSELTLASSHEHEEALDALYRLFYADPSSQGTTTEANASDDASTTSSDSASGAASSSSEVPVRDRPWKPHNSIAYDNPETNALSLLDTVIYASKNPTLLGNERRVEAISLWSTEGKMEEWRFLERVKFF